MARRRRTAIIAWFEGDERDPCGLCYTSGTTGNPKGVLYEHRSTMLHAHGRGRARRVQPVGALGRAADRADVPRQCLGPAVGGADGGCKLVLSADYRPDKMCDLFNDEKVTHSAGVPTVWLAMIEHIERTGDELGIAQDVTIGGSAAPRAMIEWLRERGHRGRPCLGHDRDLADRHAAARRRPIGTR